MATESTWLADVKPKVSHPQLEQDTTADVLIIGGGLTGLLTAYLLSTKKLNVVLIDKENVLGTATTLTTAFITQSVDTPLVKLVDLFGAQKAKKVWNSHGEAIDLIEFIANHEKINCEFVSCDAYLYNNKGSEGEDLMQEADLASKMDFDAGYSPENDLNFELADYMVLRNQAKYHPLKFLEKLAKVVEKNGVRIFEQTEAVKVNDNEVETTLSKIRAKWIVVATHLPFNNPIQTFMKKGEYTTYILEIDAPGHGMREAIYMDTEAPYHYFRVDGNRIILGGEDHRSEMKFSEQKAYSVLENYFKTIKPGQKYKVVRKWNGPIVEPADGLGLIGKVTDSQLVATGHSGNGMTYAAISAMLLEDIIMGRQNKYVDLYDPKRVSPKQLLSKGIDYTKELINTTVSRVGQR